MSEELRKSGIDIIGDVPWGTHFCQFYRTKQDLLDILVPYFKSGLENSEFCMWVTAEPVSAAQARQAMKRNMPDFEKYLARGQIEIIPYTDWYMRGGRFEENRVLQGWVDKVNQALAKGFAGLRLTGGTFWLEKRDWRSFAQYEATVNGVIGQYKMLAICTYSLEKCGSSELIDVIHTHQFALSRQEGKWDMIESAIYQQAKEALSRSEEKYRTLFNSMTEGFALCNIILDPNGKPCDCRFLEVNEAFNKFTGISPQNVIGKTVRQVIPDVKSFWIDTCGKVVLTGEMARFEDYSAPLGKWFEAIAYSPKKGQFVALFRDVTERKQAEEALARASREWQATFDSISDMVSIQDTQFRLVKVNRAFARMFGKEPEQLVGKVCYQVVHQTECPVSSCPHQEALKTGKAATSDFFEPVLGVYLEVSASPIFNDEGKLIGTAHIARDVTQRKKAEEALKESEAKYRTLVGRLQEGVFQSDLNGTYITLNDAGARILGFNSPEQAIGRFKTIDLFHDPNDRPRIINEIRTTGHFVGEVRARRKDGSVIWMLVNNNARLDERGSIVGYEGTFNDITERKKAEQLKDEFIGMVSHELKTPLTVIMGVLGTLTAKGLSKKEAQELLQDAIRCSDTLASIVENLLELSRSQANRLSLHREQADIGQIARAVIQKLQNKSAIHRLTLDFPEGLPPVSVDPVRIERILFNLVENAIKYSPKGGEVRVSAQSQDDNLVVCVSDQGPGISPDNQKKLFQSFEQLGIDNRRAMQGVGLGLKVCRTLIEAHGGSVWVGSQPGKGSSFYFTLPL